MLYVQPDDDEQLDDDEKWSVWHTVIMACVVVLFGAMVVIAIIEANV